MKKEILISEAYSNLGMIDMCPDQNGWIHSELIPKDKEHLFRGFLHLSRPFTLDVLDIKKEF